MKINYYGHSTFQVSDGDYSLLFDPFISPNELAKDIDLHEIKCDYLLISHAHQDHIVDVEQIAKNNDCQLISNYEIISWFANKGLENGHPMNHGGSWNFDFGSVKYVNAVHSSMFPDGSYGGNPGGFVVKMNGQSFYYAGDTTLHEDMKLLGKYENLDYAFLPIGDNFTMGIDDAIVASEYIGCKKIIGMHFNTFPYIAIDTEEAMRKFKDAGIELILMEIGSQINI